MDVGFIGLGKLGTPVAVSLADKFTVRGYDVNPHFMRKRKFETLEKGPDGYTDDFQERFDRSTIQFCNMEEVITASQVIFVATQTPHQEQALPADDGTGLPVAQLIKPNSAGYFQLHYLNAGDTAIAAHIDIKAYALAAGSAFTETDAYVTYQYNISVAPGATGVSVPATCPIPQGVKFWTMSTHAHKQAVETQITDGSSMVRIF